ncbi:MAG: ABC transporter permease [Chloroflexota bacterium]
MVAMVVTLAVWQLAADRDFLPRYVLPAPSRVLAAWAQLLTTGALSRHVIATLTEALLGFAIALVCGIVCAYPLAHSAFLARLASPFIAATQAMPMIALAPLLVMWFGLGLVSKVIICALIVFFPILVSTVVGLRAIDREMIEAARSMGADGWNLVRWVEAPLAVRSVLGGVRVGLTLALTGAIVGEFVASDAGLGFLMILARTNFDPAMVFAAALTMVGISTLLYKSVGWLEQAFIDW